MSLTTIEGFPIPEDLAQKAEAIGWDKVGEIYGSNGKALGFIHLKAQVDRHGNDVSLIYLANGRTFRLVHHYKEWRSRRFYTLYAAKGKFLKVKAFDDKDYPTSWIEIEGANNSRWRQKWSDGEPLCSKQDIEPFDQSLFERLGIYEDSDKWLVILLDYVQDKDYFWMTKIPTDNSNTEYTATKDAEGIWSVKDKLDNVIFQSSSRNEIKERYPNNVDFSGE